MNLQILARLKMLPRPLLIAIVAVFLCFSGVLPAHSDGPSEFTIGDWIGRGYEKSDGAIDFCAVTKPNIDGSALILGFSAQEELEIGILRLDWELPVGDTLDVLISVDGQEIGSFQTVVGFAKILRIPVGRNSSAVDRLRAGNRLGIVLAGEDFGFNLDGADEAMSAVRDCAGASN